VNGTGTFTNLANNGATANRVVVSNNAGQLVSTDFTLPTNGFVENQTATPKLGGFNINGSGTLSGNLVVGSSSSSVTLSGGGVSAAASVAAGADVSAGANLSAGGLLRIGATTPPTGTKAIISGGDTRLLGGSVYVGSIGNNTFFSTGTGSNAATASGLMVTGNIVPVQAASAGLLGDPNEGVSALNPGGRIWQGLNVLNATIGVPLGIEDGSSFGVTRLTVNGNILPGVDVSNNLGTPSFRWGTLYTSDVVATTVSAATYITTSDARLKTNITGLNYGLKTVMAMHPVRYAWKKSPTKTDQLGFLAQEIQKLVPEAVNVGTDANHTLGINYVEIVPVLVNALQEQQAEIDALKTANAALSQKGDRAAAAEQRAEKAEAALQSFESRLRALEAGQPTAQGQR
jgi:hypothetical protein